MLGQLGQIEKGTGGRQSDKKRHVGRVEGTHLIRPENEVNPNLTTWGYIGRTWQGNQTRRTGGPHEPRSIGLPTWAAVGPPDGAREAGRGLKEGGQVPESGGQQ